MASVPLDEPHKAQVGALIVRGRPGSQEVLLITSRETGRWIIPKGWPMKGKQDHEAAAQEAFEEAGVKGTVHRHPVGAYTYGKRLDGHSQPVRVMVYLMEVAEKLKDWPEKGERRRQWMSTIEASALVDEPGLTSILLRLNKVHEAEDQGAAPLSRLIACAVEVFTLHGDLEPSAMIARVCKASERHVDRTSPNADQVQQAIDNMPGAYAR